MADTLTGKLVLRAPFSGSGQLVFDAAGDDAGGGSPSGPGTLVFHRPYSADGKLVWGDAGGGEVAAPDATLGIDADLPGLDGTLTLRAGAKLGLDAGLPGLDADLALVWDAQATRNLLAWGVPHWQDGAPTAAATRPRWQRSLPAASAHRPGWQQAWTTGAVARPRWQQSLALPRFGRVAFQQGWPVQYVGRPAFEQAQALRALARARFEHGRRLLPGVRAGFQQAIQLRAGARSGFQHGLPLLALAQAWLRTGRPLYQVWELHWQNAMPPPHGRTLRPEPPVEPPPPDLPCYDPERLGLLVFERPFSGDGALWFICERSGVEPPPAAIVVPARRVYIVINSIELRRVDGDLPLPAYTFAMSLDADSWTWQWSATLDQSALARLEPAQAGEPVEVEATINGVPYRLLAESVRRERQFASTRIQVSGRGLAALLDAPYAPVLSFANAAPRSAHQLMQDALTVNNVPLGWALEFGLTDWPAPARAWAHQGTYISAINAIAQAAGGYVQPHATERTLRILHRYPAAPWHWDEVAPDIELPQDPVAIEGVQWISKPAYDRVFVAGETGGGILADVTRAGRPGELLAPMVVDALITHADAAAQRGRAILADTGAQAIVTLTLPVLPETGLILPGNFIRRTDGAEVLQGYVRGLSLAWSQPRLRQTLEVQTHA